jgi:hypothetical protein
MRLMSEQAGRCRAEILPRFARAIAAASALCIAAVAGADEAQLAQDPAVSAIQPATAAAAPRKVSPFHAMKMPEKARNQYLVMWGVDRLRVNYTMSGNLIRFSYRVADPERAKALAERSATPYLIGLKNRVVLQVPVMDKVGPLRQSTAAKAGQDYWMVFSNKGNLIKPGDRVDVAIGTFHADNLMVE